MARDTNPHLPLSRDQIESVVVDIAGSEHRASLGGTRFEVTDARVSTSWIRPDKPRGWLVRVGERVPAYLARYASPEDRDTVVAGAVVIAAVVGHPRRPEPGHRVQFVWTDHIALAGAFPLATALAISHVKTPQGRFIKELEGRVRVRGATE